MILNESEFIFYGGIIMKKMMISLLSVTMLATTIFGIQPTVARAETLPPKKQTEYKLLTQMYDQINQHAGY